ncbi:hypothetical protein A2U01_0085223, partial [Trifolium medium]|nr:hypothetical protein [Trifolium medium]
MATKDAALGMARPSHGRRLANGAFHSQKITRAFQYFLK